MFYHNEKSMYSNCSISKSLLGMHFMSILFLKNKAIPPPQGSHGITWVVNIGSHGITSRLDREVIVCIRGLLQESHGIA